MGDSTHARSALWTDHAPALNAALTAYVMDCPARLAALLAQVRTQSGSMQNLAPDAANAAGVLRLAPGVVRSACTSDVDVAGALPAGVTCADATDVQLSAVAADVSAGWRVAAWYFVHGATAVHGAPCGDLRFDADLGIGSTQSWVSRWYPGSGSYKVSTCTVGFVWDGQRESRTQAYVSIRQQFEPNFPNTCGDGLLTPGESDVDWCVGSGVPPTVGLCAWVR